MEEIRNAQQFTAFLFNIRYQLKFNVGLGLFIKEKKIPEFVKSHLISLNTSILTY